MAAILAIMRAMSLAIKRDVGSFFSVTINNLFLFAALLTYSALVSGVKPISAIPFFTLLLLIILFPLSRDPLSKVPPSRRALWPLTRAQFIELRLVSLGLSPVVWIAFAVLLVTRQWMAALIFLGAALAAQIISAFGGMLLRRSSSLHPVRVIPALPGRLGGLVRNNARQILSSLDFYATLLISLGAIFYRFERRAPDPAAYPAIAMIIALALSTLAQCSFGLDASGLVRYRLFPLRGWQILLCKDIAFLGILLIFILPVSPNGLGSGITYGLVMIAVGRTPSLVMRIPQQRWRFAGGDLRFSALQLVAAPTLAFAEYRVSSWFLGVGLLLYLVSLFLGGWYWDKKLAGRQSSI